jgi:hypothetical protein
MGTIRALTARQPWAWAIIHGGKDVENRTRNIAGSYRGPVAIHAGLAFADIAVNPTGSWRYDPSNLTRGAIIGVVDLIDVHHASDCWERDFGRLAQLYDEDRLAFAAYPDNGAGGLIGRVRHCSPWAQGDTHHLVLAAPRPLPEPIPYRGRLGLWTLPDHVAARIGVSR